MKGKAYLLGDNVGGDQIISGAYLASGKSPEECISHMFEDCRTDFAQVYRPGDIIAAGENFGCGSSREMVVVLMKKAGIRCVVAKSFSRNFYRSGINMGILPVICPADIRDGDEIEVDLEGGTVTVNGSESYGFAAFPEQVLAYINEGSLLAYFKKHHSLV